MLRSGDLLNRARLRRRPGRGRLRKSAQQWVSHCEILDRYDRTVENRHLVDLITAALEAAGPERRRAADEAYAHHSAALRPLTTNLPKMAERYRSAVV